MLVHILLVIGYWLAGIFYALLGCYFVSFIICAFVALLRIGLRKRGAPNWLLFLMYVFGALAAGVIMWSGQFPVNWVGDRTSRFGQIFLIVGMVFPGIFALKIIRPCVYVANKQTLGVEME